MLIPSDVVARGIVVDRGVVAAVQHVLSLIWGDVDVRYVICGRELRSGNGELVSNAEHIGARPVRSE